MANTTGYRSEANNFPNKKNFKKYSLSRYPNNLDTREDNVNMRGFINIGETEGIPDYVMAEYMNAAMDGVMSLQQAIGTEPMVYHGATEEEINNLIETFTVSDRIGRIENGLFDERYGGSGWTYVPGRPVLNNHVHSGVDGQPPKINLGSHVTGKLNHANINLDYRTGLTAAHISLSSANPAKLNTVIADLLSKSQGGVVSGNVSFTGATKTRISIDATASDIANKGQSTEISDVEATSGKALCSGSTVNQSRMFVIDAQEKEHLLFGRYVLGVRMKKKNAGGSNTHLVNFALGTTTQGIADTDIGTTYKTVHYIFEHNNITKGQALTMNKLSTSAAQEVMVDSYYITPIHPATLDI